ncbi:MAG: hypothetical protein JXO44_12325 [Clostridia bacterium]|nr:hypothetical protein [Clostridia bacterium]
MIFIYKYSSKAIRNQYLFSALLVIATLLVRNWLLGAVAVIVAVLFVKDALKLQRESVEIAEDGLRIYRNEKLVRELLWINMEYIVVKGKKWLVMFDGERKLTLTDQLEDLHVVAKKIIDYNRSNKSLFVDPTINDVFQVGVKLNGENHIIK